MLKPLVITAMLCAPALADTGAFTLQIQVKSGPSARTNVMALIDNACGRIEDKTPERVDEVKACAHTDGANVRVDLDWSTHSGKTEYKNQSTVVLAHGGTAEIGSPEARLSIHMP